jgi:hypothetical protein
MPTSAGPDIVNDNLTLYYDIRDTKNSYLGQPTTNLLSNLSSWGGYVTTAPFLTTSLDFPTSLGSPKVVLQSICSASRGGGGNFGGIIVQAPVISGSESASVSFWVKSLTSSMVMSFSHQNGSGDNSNLAFNFTATREWTKFTNSVVLNLQKNTYYIYQGDIPSASFQIAEFQIEKTSYPTPYVSGSRSISASLFDISGANVSITLTSMSYDSNTNYYFNGATDYITTNYDLSWDNTNSTTISMYIKPTTLTAVYNPFLGKPSLEWQFLQNNQQLIFVYFDNTGNHTNGNISYINNFFTSTDSFVNLTMVWNHVDNKYYFYRNGVLYHTTNWIDASLNKIGTDGINLGGNIYKWVDIGTINNYWSGSITTFQTYNKA